MLAGCHTENDWLSGLSSLLMGNRMEREYILSEENTARAVGNVLLKHRLILTIEALLSSKNMTIEKKS